MENKTLTQHLAELQQELNAPKNLHNSFGGYNYRSNESILEALKPLLKERGILLTQSDEMVAVGDRLYVKASSVLSDKENSIVVTAYAREEESKKGMDAAQITGAASSYARKYSLNGMFLIDDAKDADTQDNSAHETNASDKQLNYARTLLTKAGYSADAIEKRLADVKTAKEASSLIEKLK